MRKLFLIVSLFFSIIVNAKDGEKIAGTYKVEHIKNKTNQSNFLVELLNGASSVNIKDNLFILLDKNNKVIEQFKITDISEHTLMIKGSSFRYIFGEQSLRIESIDALIELKK